MKRQLVIGGRWLAGTTGAGVIAYLVTTVTAGGHHPVWPYELLLGLTVVGAGLSFLPEQSEQETAIAGANTQLAGGSAKSGGIVAATGAGAVAVGGSAGEIRTQVRGVTDPRAGKVPTEAIVASGPGAVSVGGDLTGPVSTDVSGAGNPQPS